MTLPKNILISFLCASVLFPVQAHFFKHKAHPGSLRAALYKISSKTLTTGAQATDYLLYPLTCLIVGNFFKNTVLNPHLGQTPQLVKDVERYIPGGKTIRTTTTAIALGAALFILAKKVLKIETINEFIALNMPQLSYLLSCLNKEDIEESVQDSKEDEIDFSIFSEIDDQKFATHTEHNHCRSLAA